MLFSGVKPPGASPIITALALTLICSPVHFAEGQAAEDTNPPAQGRWKIYGLHLPDDVLERVCHVNAERIFRQFKGPAATSR